MSKIKKIQSGDIMIVTEGDPTHVLMEVPTVTDSARLSPPVSPRPNNRTSPEWQLSRDLCRVTSKYMHARAAMGGITPQQRQVVAVVWDAAALAIDSPDWGEVEK